MLSDSLSKDLIVLNQNLENCLIKQVFSYPHYLVLSLYVRGRKQYLYLSRGKQAPAILLDMERIETITKLDDKYVHIFRSFLKGQFIKRVSIDEKLGMIVIETEKGSCRSVIDLFYKNSGMYFLLSTSLPNYSKYFASWQGTVNEYSSQNGIDSPIHTALLELGKISDRGLKLSVQLSNALYQDMWQKLLSREANRKVKKLELKKDKIKADILHLQQAITKMETDLANSKEIEFGEFYECAGYRVKFPAQLNSWKKREMLFNKLKSLKKGYSIQKQRLDALKSGPGLSKFVPDIRPWNPTWGKQAGKKETTVTEKCSNKDVIEFNSDSNALVKIGRNENGNDYLLTTWSKASDIWVHLHEHPSAHAIIRFTDSKREQLFELLDDISLLLKDLSGMTKERVSLIYTERRWVKPIKNDKGKVKLSKFHIYLPRK